VAETLSKLSWSEFVEWQMEYTLEPWGERRDDLRAGLMVAPILNMFIPEGKSKAKASDWLMDFTKEPEPPKTEKQMKALLKGIAGMFAAKKPKKKGK
jgi:hypothetical protein